MRWLHCLGGLTALVPLVVFAQSSVIEKLPARQPAPGASGISTFLPYNRLLRSAGIVVSYGDSSLENHALDLSLLPDGQKIVVEDRYGIAVLDPQSRSMVAKWTLNQNKDLKNLMSTFSGICSFLYKQRTFVAWGVSGTDNRSAIVLAEWDGKDFGNIRTIPLERISPAGKALPNQILANVEDETLYLYVVLNGNNQLLKLKFDDGTVVWSAATGVAPFGVCIIGDKAYVSNWAGPQVDDSTLEHAGTPWGSAYTDPATGATNRGSLSIIDIRAGKPITEIGLGLHPNSIISSRDGHFLYVANANSDNVSVVDVLRERVVDSIFTGLFSKQYHYFGSSPDALFLDSATATLYVANGMDNALAVIRLGNHVSLQGRGQTRILGFIPTEAYPSGILRIRGKLFVTNLEAKGSRILSASQEFKQDNGKPIIAYTIHKELASLSIIPVPDQQQLHQYTQEVRNMNFFFRIALANAAPRKMAPPKPLPDRIGEPSLFKHVVYIIKENKTYDQVFGDIPQGRGDNRLCIYGKDITPNQHRLAEEFCLLDNYYASGKSSAEGHQWTDAAMVSDYVERSVRAWFRSYPHRQTDALVYNKNGFIWNDALDHGKKVRIYGEACLTHYDSKMKWSDIYGSYQAHQAVAATNTSTIARIRPIISPNYPDCENLIFTDQIRAEVFISEWKRFEQDPDDSLPNLMVLSLPDDHTSGTRESFPTPRAMVADNDLALGRIVETITKSRFWDSTVIFVTEDDSQSGWDHISSYRTIGQVISPYSAAGKTIHTSYNQTSMVRTIEQILGIPPLNVIDATAQPMVDCFSSTRNHQSFQQLANTVALNEMNKPVAQLSGKAKYYALLSENKAFKGVDKGDDESMNRILWFYAKGNEKYPDSPK
jgi:hypothetical protein